MLKVISIKEEPRGVKREMELAYFSTGRSDLDHWYWESQKDKWEWHWDLSWVMGFELGNGKSMLENEIYTLLQPPNLH